MTITDIRDAAARIEAHVLRTPLVHSAWLSDLTGADVSLKLEHQQREGSFKTRGAFNALLQSSSQHVVAASAGNHGRSLAYAAHTLGVRLTVFAPRTAPASKIDYIRQHGAELELCDTYDEAQQRAMAAMKELGVPYVSPYNHPHVVAGGGTVGLEVCDDAPDVNLIVVPVGGGGLISGIAIAADGAAGKPKVIGVEAAASPAFSMALAHGGVVPIDVKPTLADGLAGNAESDTITFGYIRDLTEGVVTVTEAEIQTAMSELLAREDQRVEGAGAVGVAALMTGKVPVSGRVAVILSGANR